MCSIAGAYWFGEDKPESQELTNMVEGALQVLRRRGPDESSVLAVDQNCVMGGNRLIIRGGPGRGSMPFKDGNDVLYYNGEIYNYPKWNEKVASDGEVLLPLYNQDKYRAFNQLDGEFAIAIWDDKDESVILARDQFGTKPLYFSLNDRRLLYASSASAINSMERHDFCKSVKGPAYQHTYAVQEPYTSYRGIWQVPPGHFLVINKNEAKLFCYNKWDEYVGDSKDTGECFAALKNSLETRMDYPETMGIPMSAGVDSGIIAFTADKLKKRYHIFSLIEIFGQRTDEADHIERRINRLKGCEGVTLIKFGEEQYQKALKDMFQGDYYDSEKFDNGNLLMHAVFDAMKKENIRVVIDGSGGDELFHGYKFHNDFKPVAGWPKPWHTTNYFYGLYTTLLDYTSKSDRAGAHFSMEARYPFQNVALMKAALKLETADLLKWPLRKYLVEEVNYGTPTETDLKGKYGFSIKNKDKKTMIEDMTRSWCHARGLVELPTSAPLKFPFKMGQLYEK